MQKKRKNPPAWYTLDNLTTGQSRTIPMNRAARRAVKKMTGDVGLLPPILRPSGPKPTFGAPKKDKEE